MNQYEAAIPAPHDTNHESPPQNLEAPSATDAEDLVLIIGDFAIPLRSPQMPQAFEELLSTNKIKHVFCTGNVGSLSMVRKLLELSSSKENTHFVRGDLDFELAEGLAGDPPWPETKVVEAFGYRFGLIHGHQVHPCGDPDALTQWQRRLGCDVLIHGNSPISSASTVCSGKLLLCPGSATGSAPLTGGELTAGPSVAASQAPVPSFMLMTHRHAETALVLYVYEFRDGAVQVGMFRFQP